MLKTEPFEAVWDGFVSVELSGQARFDGQVVGHVQLELNGHPIALKGNKSGIVRSETVALRAGLNRIRVSLASRKNGEARLRLHWETNERVWEPVDPVSLVHDPTSSMQLHDSQLKRKGRELFATMNCGRCHASPIDENLDVAMPELGRDSPSLTNVGRRFGRQWLYQWIERPHAMRNQITMPQVISESADAAEIADLVAYLETLRTQGNSAIASEPRDEDELIEQGLVLYEDLGCIGCHHFEEPDSEDPYDRISLRFIADKYQEGYLLQFLLRPHAHYAWRKMPDFQLTDDEARSIAAYVRDYASPLPTREFDDGSAGRGKQIFEDRGCAACHAVDDTPLEWEVELRPVFASAHRNKGCLAQEDVQRATAPQFQLTREAREALQAFVQTDGESLNYRHMSAAAERHFEQLGCATCHRRDAAAPTLPIALLEEGEQGHPPELLPPLTWTGEKLFTPWIMKLLRGELKKKSRPWLKGRMPAFPAYAEVLAHGIVEQHAIEAKQMESVVANPDLIRVGEKLISKDEGFHCLQCHAVPGKNPEAAFESQGIDFDLIPTRVRHEYFRRWLANPPQVDPATKMPRFSPDGKTTPVTNVLDGQAARQFEALWQYIHSLEQQTP
jgi:mono/diheme cytochrome c family protein